MRKFLAFMMVLAMLLTLVACGAPTEPAARDTVTVGTVDEFLAAIGPDRIIKMEPGTYSLVEASDYGTISQNPYYTWWNVYDGYELILQNLQGLTIIGSGMGKTVLEALPCQAEVLMFVNCVGVTLKDFTVGHTETAIPCGGGVLNLEGCKETTVEGLGLFGCGTEGIIASNSQNTTVNGCQIYECSTEAIYLNSCQGVNISNSMIYNMGNEDDCAYSILVMWDAHDVTVENCSISNSELYNLISCGDGSDNITIRNTVFQNNRVNGFAFEMYAGPITMDNCTFTNNAVYGWYSPDFEYRVEKANGRDLTEEDLNELNGSAVHDDFDDFDDSQGDCVCGDPMEYQEINVSTIDEFLEALGSCRTITMEPGNYCLSEAAGYGMWSDNPYYDWVEGYDGYELNLKNIDELTIIGSGMDQTFLEALPRSVAVLRLTDCYAVAIRDMTMGHVEMAQACEGAVLALECCAVVNLENLGLYGCGTEGVSAIDSGDLTVSGCHIYDCSTFGVFLYNCDYVNITDCTIDHIGTEGDDAMSVLDANWCGTITMDGCTVADCNVGTLVYELDCIGDIVISNTEFRGNRVYGNAFELDSDCVTMDNCTFADNMTGYWYAPGNTNRILDASGAPIPEMAFWTMGN